MLKEWVKWYTVMEINLKGIIICHKNQEQVFINGNKDANIKENLKKMHYKVSLR
jgi:hypothetical protein